VLFPVRNQQERPVHALGALELALVQRGARERTHDRRVSGIDLRGGVELVQGERSIACGQQGSRELVVDERSVLGAARAEQRQLIAQNADRVVMTLAFDQSLSQAQAQPRLVRGKLDGALQKRHCRCRRTAPVQVKLRRFGEQSELGPSIHRAVGLVLEQQGEREVVVGLSVQQRKPGAQLRAVDHAR
jgi:hypothetical protein